MLTHLNVSPVAPSRVVILGASGFIARALLSKLAADKIPAVAISSRDLDLTGANAGRELTERLQPTDAVVMTAALTPDKGRDAATLMKNLRMAEAVAAALAVKPRAHFIYLSSDTVYDWRHALISESIAPSPTDLYSTMHLTREQLLGVAANTAKIPFCVLRPCAVYGPGDTHNGYGPNRFARTALSDGKIRIFGGGEETRDHVHINDVIALLELTLLHRSTGLLNAVSGQSVSFGEVARLIAKLSSRPTVVENQPRGGPITHRSFDPTKPAPRVSRASADAFSGRIAELVRYAMSLGHAETDVCGIIVLRDDDAALLQHRDDIPTINDPGLWVIPGGHVEPGESVVEGAVREVEEETCYRSARPRLLADFHATELGYTGDFRMIFFWDVYDGRQTIECREGQAAAFVARSAAESLPRRDYLTRIWDLALAARNAEARS